jgi:organic radical activating enzyme
VQNHAQLSEIFSSFQGEGLYVGERQIFIRFAGCNLSCQYCDTPQALVIPKTYKVEKIPGSRRFESFPNPIELQELINLILALNKPEGINQAISLTGGEPLLQVDFIKNFISELKKKIKILIYLETNGVLPKHLSEIIELIDITAFDFKLQSATGLSSYLKEHREALEIAYLKEVFVKVVFTRESTVKEIDEVASMVASVDEKIPLVLQPVTPFGPIKHRPTLEQMVAFYNVAKKKLKTVRVIPQMHKLFGIP